MIVKLKDAGNKEAIELAKLREEIRTSGARVSRRAKEPKWHMWVVYAVVALCAPFMVVVAFFGAIYDKFAKH